MPSVIAKNPYYRENRSHCIVQVQEIPILPPQKGLEFPGGVGWGFCETKKFQEMCEVLLEFPEALGGEPWVLRKNPFCGGGVDIFWNCTLHENSSCQLFIDEKFILPVR